MEIDTEYNKKFQKRYKETYNIEIPDEVVNRRIAFCDKVKIVKNTYNIQEIDYQKYFKDLLNGEIKCLQHINMNPNDDWNINLWLIYFTFGIDISEIRIKLIKQLQSGKTDVIDKFIEDINYDIYL